MSPRKIDLVGAKGWWQQLLIFAAWLIAAAGSFLTFPVELSYGTEQGATIAGFTQTLVAIACGLTLVAVNRSSARRRFRRRYLALCLGGFAIFIVLMLTYVFLQGSWICRLHDAQYVVGGLESRQFKDYLAGPLAQSTCEAHLQAFQGNTLAMYDRAGLILRFVLLAILYMAAWAQLAVVVVLLGFGLSETTPNREPAG